MQRTTLVPAVLTTVLLLAGCSAAGTGGAGATTASSASAAASDDAGGSASGGGSGLSAAEVAKDACSVISAEEAAAAYGGGITEAQGVGGSCEYIGLPHAITTVYSFGGDQVWESLRVDGTPAIDGVGDRAEVSPGAVLFQKGNWVVGVSEAAGNSSSTPKVTALAKAIAAKL